MISVIFLFLASSVGFASESSFTVRIDHFEYRGSKTIEGFSGRSWDLNNLLQTSKDNGDFQWARIKKSKNSEFIGSTICVRIAQSTLDKQQNRVMVSYPIRLRALRNLLVQLNLRKGEMNRSGAIFKIEYPSRCDSTLKGFSNY